MRGIGDWLDSLGLAELAPTFADAAIDFDILAEISEGDLEALGIPLGHRKRLLKGIAQLDRSDPSGTSERRAGDYATREQRLAAGAERRQVTVMFCDLVGSTALSARLDPEDMREVVRTYQETCARTVARFEGFVAKFMGDGVLAYFGYPHSHEDEPERAVRAGLELVTAVAALQVPTGHTLACRIGIATGLVVVGDLIGEGMAEEGAIAGETPNLAARLQGLAQPGAVVVAPATRSLLRGVFDLKDLGEHDLKGFETPVIAWQVMGESTSESRFEARTRYATPLVGRDDEVEMLRRRWRRATGGEGQVALINGEPGIGKSRLAATLRQMVAHEPHTRLTYQCSPHHTENAFHPVIRQLEHAAGLRPDQDPAEKFDRLEALLSPSRNDTGTQVPLLASLLSIPVTSAPAYGAQELKERTLRALLGQLEMLAAARPVMMLFEDLHWADPSTLELLDRLVERVETLPVLILLTSRPGFGAAWTDQAYTTVLNLNRIGRRESRALLESLAGDLSDDLIEAITAKGDGIPLFLEEIGRTVLEGRREDDGVGIADQAEVPASLRDSLMARLDRLPTAKPVAQTAAALGRDFSRQMLEPLCDLPPADLDTALTELVGAGVLNTRGGSSETFEFKHALVQDAAYDSLLRGSRRQLHRRIAETLGELLSDQPALLAHHWERAADIDQALKYRLQAGQRAGARFAIWEAFAQYWRALDLLLQLPESVDTRRRHLDTVIELISFGGDLWETDAERDRALRHIDRAIQTATSGGHSALLARLTGYKGVKCLDEALLAEARRHASNAKDQMEQAYVEDRHAGFYGQLGRFEDSLAHIERAIEIWSDRGAEIQQGLAMASTARCFSARAGWIERSFHFAERARVIAETTGDLRIAAWLPMEAEPCLYKGLWRRTVDIVDRELPATREIGNWASVLWCSGWAAIAEVKLGRFQAASTRLETAFRRAWPRCQSPFARTYPLIALGHVHLAQGEFEAALDTARRASESAERAEARLERGAAHRLLGQIHEAKGDRPGAAAALQESLEILRAIQSRPELAQSLLAYGRFKRADDPDESNRVLGEALALFEGMDATGWIEETRAALDRGPDGDIPHR